MSLRILCLALLFWIAVPTGTARAQEIEGVEVTEQGVLLDFQGADLRLVVAALAEAARINVVYSELPSRRVSLRMTRPVPREELPALLRSIAESNGLEVTESEGFLRLEPGEGGGRRRGAENAEGADMPAQTHRLYVYRLKHAQAAQLASTLRSIFGGQAAPEPDGGAGRPTRSQRSPEQSLDPFVPEEPAEVEVDMGAVEPSLPGELSGEVQIVPDEATNSLLVRALPADWEIVDQAIASLDLRPLQVLIEVLIAEVRRTSDFDVGVSIDGGEEEEEGEETGTGDTRVSGELEGASAGDFAVRVDGLGDLDVDIALSALSARGEVRILSRPVVLAQNNQEASIMIGAERPFIQVFRSLPTDAAIRDQIIQYRDVGTLLTIQPTINPDGGVNLEVVQEVSTATSETQFGAPVISTREASTRLFVRDGRTAVIGGLIDRQRDENRTGIPLLMDIPLLGNLFSSTRNTTINTELFLFLTPHIVETDEDTDRIREEIESEAEMLEELLPEPRTVVPPRPDLGPDTLPSPADTIPADPEGAAMPATVPGVRDTAPGAPEEQPAERNAASAVPVDADAAL